MPASSSAISSTRDLLDGLHPAAEGAAHLACGLAGLGQGLGFNQVAHGLGLREVELAGEKRALGEFARLGETRAEIEGAAQQQVQNDGRAVRGDFDEIVGGVGVGRGKIGDDGFVDLLGGGRVVGRIKDVCEPCARMFQRMMKTNKLGCDRCRLRAAEAHDADTAASGRRGDGRNRIGGGDFTCGRDGRRGAVEPGGERAAAEQARLQHLLLLAAGTMTDANGATNFTAQFAINGQRGVEATFAMDGADISDPEMGGATFSNFNVDAVEEIESSSGWMPAEIGRGAAGFTNIITRSGASGFHGSFFEFVRNSAFDARNYFDHATPAYPGRIPPFRRNEFGFTNGGPVFIPHIYDGRKRTFYFTQYQGFRQVLGTTQVMPVPTPPSAPARIR
jgi:hypothetical protein